MLESIPRKRATTSKARSHCPRSTVQESVLQDIQWRNLYLLRARLEKPGGCLEEIVDKPQFVGMG